MKTNQIAGVWRLRGAVRTVHVLHRPGLPSLASGDPLAGTDEENARAVRDTLVVLGADTVDADGAFKDEEVLRSSFRFSREQAPG